jgi:hypothetical protein
MHGAFGGRRRSPEEFPDLAGAPVWFVALEADDQAVDLAGQLVGA